MVFKHSEDLPIDLPRVSCPSMAATTVAAPSAVTTNDFFLKHKFKKSS